jgi:GTP cyclohydrolase IB
MNAPEPILLPDVQSQADTRNLPIEAVGVKGLRYPVTVVSGGTSVATVADFTMTVALPATVKGTHMSRFVEMLERQTAPLDIARFADLVRAMCARLGAAAGAIEMRFPWFLRKTAPVSGVQSLLDYAVTWRGQARGDGDVRLTLRVEVPVTSLCPCSKDISEYGAHNQRSHVAIEAELAAPLELHELIGIAEAAASCEIYGLLKRVDEKYVTERAYDNPKFVEDLVRDIAARLRDEPRVARFVVEAENFESIHNHSAFARIGTGALA